MTRFESYWMSNDEWLVYNGGAPSLKSDAPAEAWDSYNKFVKEVHEAEERHARQQEEISAFISGLLTV